MTLILPVVFLILMGIGEAGHQLQPRVGRVTRTVSYPLAWAAVTGSVLVGFALSVLINRIWRGW